MKNEKTLFDSNLMLMILSFISAVALWGVVAYNVDTVVPVTIKNVPVVIDEQDTTLTRLNLYAVTNGEFTIDVEVSGTRATVGNISVDEIIATARLNNISGPGTYDLTFEIADSRGRDIEIKTSSPESISVRFDHKLKRTFTLEKDLNGLSIADGYVLGEEYLTPTQVVVTGPETEVKLIKGAGINLEFTDALDKSFIKELPIILYDEEGHEISSPYIELDLSTATITLPVLKKKTIPVDFNFVNVPQGFDVSTLEYSIDPMFIEVAGPESMLDSFNSVHLGYVDVRTISPELNLFYSITLPTGFISIEGIEEAAIEFHPNKFESVELNIDSSNIYVINSTEEYDVTVQSRSISGVLIYGPAEDIAELTSKDLIAQVNMDDAEMRMGQITAPVDIIIPGSSSCWAYGDRYTVILTVRAK